MHLIFLGKFIKTQQYYLKRTKAKNTGKFKVGIRIMSNQNKPILTENQVKFIIDNFIHSRKKRNQEKPTEEECMNLIRWAEATLVNYAYLNFVMTGALNIDMIEGTPVFENPNFVPPQEIMSNKELLKNKKFLSEGTEILKEMTKHLRET